MSSNAINRFIRVRVSLEKFRVAITPWFRACIRVLALPYWYCFRVDRSKCRIGNWQILKDFAYIVLVLRDFPNSYYPSRLWEKDRSEWAYYYGSILNPFQRAALLKTISPIDYHVLAGNKEATWLICQALDIPHVEILAVIGPQQNASQEIGRLFRSGANRTLIIKPVLGSGGENIKLIFEDGGNLMFRDYDRILPIERLGLDQQYVVQPYLQQHADLDRFFPHAVNTIRAITVYDCSSDRVLLLGANLRTATRETYVDNMHQGGIAVGIDTETGCLSGRAMDYEANIYTHHPVTGVPISGFQLPLWEQCHSTILETQRRFNKLALLGQDIAITPQGPRILELNHQPFLTGFEQACGPILKNRETWEFFRKSGLLINPPSRRLYAQ